VANDDDQDTSKMLLIQIVYFIQFRSEGRCNLYITLSYMLKIAAPSP